MFQDNAFEQRQPPRNENDDSDNKWHNNHILEPLNESDLDTLFDAEVLNEVALENTIFDNRVFFLQLGKFRFNLLVLLAQVLSFDLLKLENEQSVT